MTPAPQQAGAVGIGLETYNLEAALGADPSQAAEAAITAAIRAHETAVLHRISRAAELVAASLLAEPSGRYRSHAAAVTWFAERHILALPALADTNRYQPKPGDIIEVTLTGAVLAGDDDGTWTLADKASGRWYRFEAPGRNGAPKMRVLDTAQAASSHESPLAAGE